MLNPLAERLIHNLRHDPLTRQHYSIVAWEGRRTCGSVGCIAGTAIAMAHNFVPEGSFVAQCKGLDITSFTYEGAKLLGLSDPIANQLFVPWEYWVIPLRIERHQAEFLTDLGANERPPLDTVDKMIAWAASAENPLLHSSQHFNPDASANALEAVTRDEMPYVDWARAHELA